MARHAAPSTTCPHCGEDTALSAKQVRIAKELSGDLVATGWSKSSADEYAKAALAALMKRYDLVPLPVPIAPKAS